MEITGELQITYPALRRIVFSAIPGYMRAARISGMVVIGVTLLFALTSGVTHNTLKLILLGAVPVLLPELMAVLGWRSQRKLLSQPVRYLLTASGIQAHSPTTHVQVDWVGVRQVRRRRSVWLIKHAGPQQVALPRAAFSPANREAIDRFFAERFSTGRAGAVA